MTRPRVTFADTSAGIDAAMSTLLADFGGAGALIKSSRDVYLKVNLVDSKPHSYTDPAVIRAAIGQFQRAGARRVFVIENCTQGNFTRLVFAATGVDAICRETGAIPIYLDETPAHPVYLEGLDSFIDISAFVYERLVAERDRNLYVSLPKLKTHSMSQVTLSIKNQYGLVHQGSRSADHNFKLHQKFADIYKLLRPDFVIVDGLVATNHGHYIAESLADECIIPMNCLIGGADPLAVDTVAAAFLGFGIGDVKHLALAAATGIGESRLEDIDIGNRAIFDDRRRQLSADLLRGFPADIDVIRGQTRCCREGCWRNTENLVEVLRADHGGGGGFTVVMGKDADPAAVARLTGPVHLAGSCAIQDHGLALQRRLGKRLTLSHGCNNLAETIHGLCKQMKVAPLELATLNPLRALALLAQAKLHRSRALIPPLI
jgi:uncharacterized protein (DUF362 family)